MRNYASFRDDWSERCRLAHYSRLGKARAEFWRALGFPNLLKARAVLKQRRDERKIAKAEAEARAKVEASHQLRAFMESTRDDL